MSRPMHPALPWRLSPTRPQLALANHSRIFPLTLVALTCVGFALRLPLLSAFPLREDEAIYGFWARAALVDPFFLQIWPDKPPLFIWLLASMFALLGPGEASARLVGIFASTLTIPVVALGAQRLWRSSRAALLAALLIALNPFAVSFAPTAYTDSVLVLLGTGALVCALSGRGLGAGLLLGAACMTKQQGLLFVPLVMALLVVPLLAQQETHRLWITQRGASSARSRTWAELGWAVLGVALTTLPIVWWDSQRWALAPSPWALAQQTYAPIVLLSPEQWLGRGQAWANLLWYLGGSHSAWAMLAAAFIVAVSFAIARAWRRVNILLLLAWGFGFVLLHVVTSMQVWDRYLLPLAPWLALVASGPLAMALHRRLPDWGRGVLFLLLVIAMAELVPPAVVAARGQMPIGGDHGDYAGLTEAIAWVQAHCDSPHPYNLQSGEVQKRCPAILYHQVLGWHFRFYLYDELQAEGNDPPRFDLRWFPSAAYLADNAAKSPYPPKYLILPDWATPRDLALHLAMRGLLLETRLRVGRFAVMEIVQPPRPACDWCKSSPPFIRKPQAMPVAPQMSTP